MTNDRFDVAVVGLGAMGSAAAYHLASRGVRVVGFDRYAPPHALGSSHGYTRIIREAYYEHPLYVPLVQRAYELWAELERAAGERLYIRTGGLMAGVEGGALVQGALRSVREHNLAHEVLEAAEVMRRFPAYRLASDWLAVYEPRAGLLLPEACIDAHLTLAAEAGAVLRLDEGVMEWRADEHGVSVVTSHGTYHADRAILAVGPWLPQMANGARLPLVVERQLSHWFMPLVTDGSCSADTCPLGLWEPSADHLFLTTPDIGQGVKCGGHHDGFSTTPESVHREVSDEENAGAHAFLERVMPGAAGPLREARVCLYTNTPDQHFLIDWHPDAPRVLLASPCSGHGFKFSSAIGEILADLASGALPQFDLSPFSLARFR